jgi:hypothetical protein
LGNPTNLQQDDMSEFLVVSVDPNTPVSGHGQLSATAYPYPTELVYFEVTGFYGDVESPNLSGSSNVPLFEVITASVVFWPRIPFGTIGYIENLDITSIGYTVGNTGVAFAPIQARILSGQLQTIDVGDTVGISLLANTVPVSAALAAAGVPDGVLIYDVAFSDVVYGEAPQTITNFAFVAPTTNHAICLTDTHLQRLPYQGP